MRVIGGGELPLTLISDSVASPMSRTSPTRGEEIFMFWVLVPASMSDCYDQSVLVKVPKGRPERAPSAPTPRRGRRRPG